MKQLIMLCLLCLTSGVLAEKTLNEIILAHDKKMFDAFNTCDIDTMAMMFSKDLEFYHDIAGLSGYESTMKVTRDNCERKLGLQRTLLKEGTEISPLGEFGAMQKGKHRFCHMNNGVEDCGIFDFMHIWKKQGETWTIHRVISYNH